MNPTVRSSSARPGEFARGYENAIKEASEAVDEALATGNTIDGLSCRSGVGRAQATSA